MSNFMLLADTAAAQTTFCTDSANIWQLVGYVLLVFKIVIPILLIIFGMIDLGSAVVAGKDDEVKKNIKKLMWRAIAAVVVFFIPTLVSIIMGFVSNFKGSGAEADFDICRKCIANPGRGKCAEFADKANNGLVGTD